jgi:hypothetical protein
MFVLKHYFLSEVEREKLEEEIFLSNPDVDREVIFSMDDKELLKIQEKFNK